MQHAFVLEVDQDPTQDVFAEVEDNHELATAMTNMVAAIASLRR
jgi:hypothetical protein